MNTTDTLSKVSPTRYEATANGVTVTAQRNGSDWAVSTYMADVPFGSHHRMIAPSMKRARALELAEVTAAAIDSDVRYETTKRGYENAGMTVVELADFQRAILDSVVAARA